MTLQDRQKVYLNAFIRFGEKAQMVKTIEEMSELTKELCKRFEGTEDTAHIAEEIADVQIMLEQMIMFFDIQEVVDFWTENKIQRLDDRLKEV